MLQIHLRNKTSARLANPQRRLGFKDTNPNLSQWDELRSPSTSQPSDRQDARQCQNSNVVMRWLTRNGHRPIDEFVELVSYRQSRNYMKRTTETYARYKYLYDQVIYEQPLAVDPNFLVNDIDY